MARHQKQGSPGSPSDYGNPGDPHLGWEPPVETPVSVRVLNRWDAQGDLQGFDYAPAERKASTPKIICLVEKLVPRRMDVFSVEAGEAYKVEDTDPVDGITVTANCHRITDKTELTGLPLPVVV